MPNILLGGSLKKYNRIDLKIVLLGIILPILAFFISMSGVYAYFTARANKEQSSSSTGIVRISTSDDQLMINGLASTSDSKLLPGDTITYSGKVYNNGTVAEYVIIEFEVKIDGVRTIYSVYTGDGNMVTNLDNNVDNPAATLINAGAKQAFEIDYIIPQELGDEYQQKETEVNLHIIGVQTANISDGDEAMSILLTQLTGFTSTT